MRSRTRAFVLAMVMGSAPAAVLADPFHAQVSVGTELPIALSVRGDVELPGRLRLMASGGVTPEVYLRAYNGILHAAAGSSQSGGGLFGMTVDSGSAWRVHGGWRPFSGAGLVLMAGYGRLNLAGSANARDVITSVTGSAPPSQVPEANGVYDVRSTLHMFDAELGWEFLFFGDHLVIQTSVGVAATVDSSTTITPRFTSSTPGAAQARTVAQGYVDQALQSYVFLPTFSLSLGYRFL